MAYQSYNFTVTKGREIYTERGIIGEKTAIRLAKDYAALGWNVSEVIEADTSKVVLAAQGGVKA